MVDLQDFKKITTFVFDVDGVFTNSQMLITEEGHLLRSMNVRDGFAVKVALKAGYRMFVITGGSSQGVMTRLKGLGIKEIYSGIWNKETTFLDILSKHELNEEEVLYIGDDLIDIPCIQKAGIGVCPKDAAPEVLAVADHITQKKGGAGCVREVIQSVLELQSKWLTTLT